VSKEFESWLAARLDKQDETLAEIKVDLAVHMKRTDIAEENIKILRKDVEPLKAHVSGWAWAGKALAALGTLAAIIFGALEFFGR
jgi:hypothetical protein